MLRAIGGAGVVQYGKRKGRGGERHGLIHFPSLSPPYGRLPIYPPRYLLFPSISLSFLLDALSFKI